MVKQAWKPIERYFDLDGISERLRNREAFAAFIKTFGWTQYMFHPIVMDFQKLLDGRDDYNEEKRSAVGFDRLPDITFERLEGHARAFKHDKDVMLALVVHDLDREKIDAWCTEHNAKCVICSKERAFHNNGTDYLVLFMNDSIARKYASELDAYRDPALV